MGTLIKADMKKTLATLHVDLTEAKRELAEAKADGNELLQMAIMAAAQQHLRECFDSKVMAVVLPLMNSPLGFLTDRDPAKGWQGKPYGPDVVRDVLICGQLQGARVVGNEINIIASGLYLTRQYYERQLREMDGVTNIEPPSLGIPRSCVVQDKTYAEVQAVLKFHLDGKPVVMKFTDSAAIRVFWNKGMTIDGIHGKVKKRIYKAACELVSGHEIHESGDDDAITVEPVTPAKRTTDPDTLAGRIAACETVEELRAFVTAEGKRIMAAEDATPDDMTELDQLAVAREKELAG